MVCELSVQCDLVYRFQKCALPEDTKDVDLKVCILKGINTFKKDYKLPSSKCSPWGTEVQPYPILRKKRVEFMHRREKQLPPMLTRPTILKPAIPSKKQP